jgi:hypothetical protein
MQMWKQFRDGAPDHIKQILPETYDASVPKLLSAMHNAVTQTPEHKRDIDKVRVQGEEARKLQELKNAGDLRTAQARQTQKTLDFDQALKKATTSAHIMSIAQQIQNDPDLPADKRDSLMARANAAYQAMVKLEASRADARTPPLKQAIEGGVGDAVANRLEGPPQQPGVAKRHSMSELRRLYPGKSDKQLKEAYKKKFGFDPLP